MNFSKSTVILTIINFFSRIIGYLRDVVLASFLGTGVYADIYAISYGIPLYIRAILFEGTFNAAYIPTLNSIKNSEDRNFFFSQLLFIFLLFFIPLTILLEIFMPSVLAFLVPGFINLPEFELATLIARITTPYMIFMVIIAFLVAALNQNFLFRAAALIHIIMNLVIILALFFSINSDHLPIKYVAWGLIVSGVLQTVFLLYNLNTSFLLNSIQVKKFLNGKILIFFNLLWPGLIIYGLPIFNRYVGNWFASNESGGLSYLYYGERVFYIPITIIALSMSTVLLPYISESLRQKDHTTALKYQKLAYKYTILFILPASFSMFLLSENIIEILFQRGLFNEVSTYNTAIVLKALAFAMPASALNLILLPYFFSSNKLNWILIYSILISALNFILTYILFDNYGFIVIPIIFTLTSWIFLILTILTMYKYNFKIYTPDIIKCTYTYLLCSIGIFVYIYFLKILFSKVYIVELFLIIISSVLIYFCLILLFDKKVLKDFLISTSNDNKF